MSVKKQIPNLCKLYSLYEEIPEEILDETDVDSSLYHSINSWAFHSLLCFTGWNELPSAIIKTLSTLNSNLTAEALLEKCLDTVQVLVVETECIQFP